jgi:two-component system, cell cycle response regulator CpdR
MRILLADDDNGTRELVNRALKSDGHTVEAVGDGTAAVERIEGASYDLLIADVDMPGYDGISVAKRARETLAGIGIILISAHEAELSRASQVSGAKVEVLTKPFSLDALRSVIAKVA